MERMTVNRTGRQRHQRGYVLLMWTLMMLFIVIPVVGLAVDAGIVYFIKGKLQAAVDGAALGAARSLNRGQDIPSQQASATDTAIRYYHANFPSGWMGVTPVNDPTVTWPTAPPATAIINVQGDVDAPTWFMRILGVSSLHLTVVGQSSRRNVNIMLVLDRSTSLSDSGSCDDLATDSQLFVSLFSNNRDRMGLTTYGTYYNVDFAPAYDFQSGLTSKLANLKCSGFTNAAAAFWTGYKVLRALADLNALNVILFFTDGQPNTMSFGVFSTPTGAPNGAPGGNGPLLIKKSTSTCNATAGFSGVIAGDVGYSVSGGVYKPVSITFPAPAPFPADIAIIDSTYGNNGGCSFRNSPYYGNPGSFVNDVAYLPATDAFGNATGTSILGGTGFPKPVTKYTSGSYSGQIVVNNLQTLENAGINTLDNAAQRARLDAASANMPYVVYTIGLGDSGGVNDELLKRVANDPNALAHQSAYTDGIYIYIPDIAHLSAAFATIASDTLRISK